MDASAEHGVAGGGHLCGVHPLRRPVRLSHHPDQSGLEKVSQLHLHLPLYHAPVDPGRGVAEPVQLQCRHRHLQRPAGRHCRHHHAHLVVQGPVPQHCGAGPALCSLRLYPHRRHLPQHGCQPGGGGHHSGYPQVEDHVPGHPAHGQARHFVHHPAGVRQRHGLLSRAPLSGADHPGHQVCVHELQIHRRGQHPGHHHDDLRRGHHAPQPAQPAVPQKLHHRHRQVRPDLQDQPGPGGALCHRPYPGGGHLLHQHLPHCLLRL